MRVYQSPRFKKQFEKLPQAVQKIARRKIDIFVENSRDPSLRVHKLQGELSGSSAFSVTHTIRIIFEVDEDDAFLMQIGPHSIYD